VLWWLLPLLQNCPYAIKVGHDGPSLCRVHRDSGTPLIYHPKNPWIASTSPEIRRFASGTTPRYLLRADACFAHVTAREDAFYPLNIAISYDRAYCDLYSLALAHVLTYDSIP
jgi:hypothetical protein